MESWLIASLTNKFTGRAASAYIPRLGQYTSIERMLSDLNLQYGHVGGPDNVLAELKSITQKPGEGAGEYGLRVENLYTRLLNIYDSDEELIRPERFMYKIKAESEAKEQFILGLRGDLQHQVRSQNPQNIREAIRWAVWFEQKTGARRGPVGTPEGLNNTEIVEAMTKIMAEKMSSPTSFASTTNSATIRLAPAAALCTNCNKSGHTAVACWQGQGVGKSDEGCHYCGLQGHNFRKCQFLEEDVKAGRCKRERTQTPVEIAKVTNVGAPTTPRTGYQEDPPMANQSNRNYMHESGRNYDNNNPPRGNSNFNRRNNNEFQGNFRNSGNFNNNSNVRYNNSYNNGRNYQNRFNNNNARGNRPNNYNRSGTGINRIQNGYNQYNRNYNNDNRSPNRRADDNNFNNNRPDTRTDGSLNLQGARFRSNAEPSRV